MSAPAGTFKERVDKALDNAQLKIALERTTGNARRKRAAAVEAWPDFVAARAAAAAIKDHALAHMASLSGDVRAQRARLRREGPLGARPGRGLRDRHRHLQGGRREDGDALEKHAGRGNRPAPCAGRRGHSPRRDRSRRTYHPARRRDALAYHLARRPSHPRGRGQAFRPISPRKAARARHRKHGRLGAQGIARGFFRRRSRHFRRQFPGRGNRRDLHHHQ